MSKRPNLGLSSTATAGAFALQPDLGRLPAKPWDGADTLEWTLPSPVPYHTFETPPVVK